IAVPCTNDPAQAVPHSIPGGDDLTSPGPVTLTTTRWTCVALLGDPAGVVPPQAIAQETATPHPNRMVLLPPLPTKIGLPARACYATTKWTRKDLFRPSQPVCRAPASIAAGLLH